MITQTKRNAIRQRIHDRIRRKLSGTAERPRLNVYRSLNHIYAQVIDDQKGETLVSASSIKLKTGGNVAAAKEIGKAVAEAAVEQGHQEGGLRSRRLPLSRAHQGAGRCGPRRRAWSSKSSEQFTVDSGQSNCEPEQRCGTVIKLITVH
jgi:large subunit ribosomal protein L18